MPLFTSSPFLWDEIPKIISDKIRYTCSRSDTDTAVDEHSLCRRCGVMLHGLGIKGLFSSTGFQHSTLDTFASRPECRLCQFLWCEDLIGSANQANRIRRLSDLVNPRTGLATVREPKKALVILTAIKQNDATKIWKYLEVKVMSERGRLLWQPAHHLHVAVPDNSPFADLIYWRHVRWAHGDLGSLPMLRDLLEFCRNNHDGCPQLCAKPLPTRVLRLSGKTPHLSLSLHESSLDEVGEYTALSYCWGGPQELCLTIDNLQSFKETLLAIDELPQTLADAALVTHAMGLQYIWVDALCIIQDSPADKECEIERMCAIYQNSVVTIAASTSDSVKNGFLNQNTLYNSNSASCTIQLPVRNDHGEEAWTDVTFSSTRTQHTDEYPINKRGWTFQEAFMPHRILVFGDIEPFLRCRSDDTVVLSRSAMSYDVSRIEPRRVLYDGIFYKASLTEENEGTYFRQLWQYIVEQYSQRTFSFEEDRPLAIRGIIQYLSSVYEGQCYHGIWTTCSIGCLLWKGHQRSAEKTVRQPQVPTWSWLSLSFSDIDLDFLGSLGSDEGEATVHFTDASHNRLEITCQVLQKNDVFEAGDLVEYWDDYGREWADVDDPEWEQVFLLVLARTVDQKLFTIEVVRDSDGMYRRRGIMEIRGVEKWLSRPKITIAIL